MSEKAAGILLFLLFKLFDIPQSLLIGMQPKVVSNFPPSMVITWSGRVSLFTGKIPASGLINFTRKVSSDWSIVLILLEH